MIEYRVLGKTGIQVSNLCLGTMTFGREADAQEAERIYRACRDRGINFIDTSNNYAKGESERILGRLIASERDQIILATKVSSPTGEHRNARGFSRRNIMAAVENSLQRLRTDYIDLYLLHHVDQTTPLDDVFRTLNDLVTQGKVHYIGVSNFAAWQIQKAIGLCQLHDWHVVQCIQPMYNLLKRQAEVEILPMAQAENLGVMTYSPLAAGLLTGKYRRQEATSGRLTADTQYQQRYAEPWLQNTVETFVHVARDHGVSPTSLAIAWVAHHPAVTAPIIGARNIEQLQDALDAVEMTLTDDLYAHLSHLSPTPPLATDRAEEAQSSRH